MAMGRERKFMPILVFVFLAMFIFGFVKILNGFKPTARVLSYRDAMCGDMFISEAILLAQNSNCMSVGTLDVYEYECNEDIRRVTFPIEMEKEEEGVLGAKCHVFTDSNNTHLQLVYDEELE